MSASRDMPPPATKGRAASNKVADVAPDPNANRAADYPNEWKIEHNKQTARCMICGTSQAGTKWCVSCTNCSKRICSPCWKGERFNNYGEAIFEGKAQNEEGCWCRFPNKTDPSYSPAFEARNQRTKAAIAAEKALEAQNGGSKVELPAAKRQKLDYEDEEDDEQFMRGRRSDYPQLLQSPDDWEPRRRSSAEDSVQQDGATAFHRETRSNLKERHVHHKRTIVVGAGVVGLSIARELAARTYNTATDHEIVVVEKQSWYGQGASGHCAGLITKHGVPEVFGSLLELSLKCWAEQLANKGFRDEIQYVPNNIVHVKTKAEGRSDHTASPPSWYNVQPEDVFKTYGNDVGKISTKHLVDFLYEECQNTGVAFRFGQEIKRIEKSMRGELQAVDIGSSKPGNVNEINVNCANIIVAAGAQTPEALDDIITWLEPKATFENHTQIYEWVRAPMGDPFDFDSEELEDASLIIRGGNNNIAGKGKGKAKANATSSFPCSYSILTTEPRTNTILAATISKHAPTLRSAPIPGVDTKTVSKAAFSEAEKLARTHLKDGKLVIPVAASSKPDNTFDSDKDNNNGNNDSDNDSDTSNSNVSKSPVLKTIGSATVSTSFAHSPLVTMIPWNVVDPRVVDTVKDYDDDGTTAKHTLNRLGIYVAYGLGQFGTTLAPGVARFVCAKVYGDAGKVGVDGKGWMDEEEAGGLEAVGEAYGWPEGFDE